MGAIKSLLGEYAESLNEYRTAHSIYRSLAAAAPTADTTQGLLADTLREMGIQYQALGELAAAQSYFEQAVAIAERFAQANPSDENRQSRLAGYYLDLGTAQSRTGDLSTAEQSLRQSVAVRQQIVEAHPDAAQGRQGLARSQAALANALRVMGRLVEARATAQDVIQSYEAVIAAGRASSSDQYELARGLSMIGNLEADSGQYAECRKSYDRAAGLLEALVAANPRVASYQVLLGEVCANWVGQDIQGPKVTKEEFAEELRVGQRGIEIFNGLAKAEPDVPAHPEKLVRCYDGLAVLHRKNDDHEQALACFRKALEIGEPLVATRPGLLVAGATMSVVYLNLAEELINGGDWAGARPLYKRHRDLLGRLIAEFPRMPTYRDQLRIALFRLSQMNLGAGRFDEAERESRQVLALAEELLRDNPDIALLPPRMTRLARYGSEHRDLAEILVARGRFAEAISFYTKGIAILEDAIRRQPLDVNAPVWLVHLRDARAKAQAKLDETSKTSGTAGGSHLPSTSSRSVGLKP